ncbi:DNA-binding transcriptional LysR family regulator [Aminobacter aminovorans]|jgi:DNA-binding transcriptional LysR family regulator|uniref:Hca operon transcriptional activator n=1 Tax=Aminobacter aminovorans TaxID=83263 RepID=A0A380WGF0_AMIAI|nr:LysR family transcriptional regulator [Aminobacter aminovorans]TCS26864.1 DNA-binding transcriptional LysR family regulator [Aminobacter aminovorans]SUU88077.1 Hca operon transcriptional activator [Aminobacter aminovorans]
MTADASDLKPEDPKELRSFGRRGIRRTQLLKNLQHFVVAAELGSFHRAADRLAIVQSALSRRIGELEAQLGGRLFERQPTGVRLTLAGAALLEDASRILREVDLAIRRFDLIDGGQMSLLRVGFNGAAMMFAPIPDGLQTFRIANPTVEVRLTPMLSEQAFQALAAGSIDLGLAYELGYPHMLKSRQLVLDDLALALPEHHPLAAKAELAVEHLDGADFIGMDLAQSGLMAEKVAQALQSSGVAIRVLMETGSTEATLSLVAAGLGIAFVNRSQAGRHPPNVVIRDVAGFSVPLSLKLFWRAEIETPVLLRFVETLAGQFEAMG